MNYAVIMAGGVGSRFWPKSRLKCPKQFLKLVGEKTMLQSTVDRILPLIPMERILVITNADYTDLVKEQLPGIPPQNVIGEPIGRNTAPCIALAAIVTEHMDPNPTMIVLPSDHYIRDEKEFRRVLSAAAKKATDEDVLITVGIRPNRPETGYGYIQVNDNNGSEGNDEFCVVKTFAEKPDLQTAINFIASGDFYWNSGMFIWKSSSILRELQKHLPEIHREVQKVRSHVDGAGFVKSLQDYYQSCMSISIDYGVMEKAGAVHVIPAEFGWNDVGSWLAVYELEEKGMDGNVIHAPKTHLENCQNCYVVSESDKLIAMVGLQGFAYVETEDAVLICRLEESQEVKKLVETMDRPDLKKFK
ncbi:MAG: mannose-1-phosphate guanylyltransferase [Balneolaceae bacterium]|jgi:mannose-1-phosphate guanylyltransferase|nr:MAG: mannose-1-phosphate guanylyltransferase [Balneolaceae bacterium]